MTGLGVGGGVECWVGREESFAIGQAWVSPERTDSSPEPHEVGKHSSLQEVLAASRLCARIVAHAAPRKGWMQAWLAKQQVLPQGL